MTEISPAFGVIILLNNYLHDIATALLGASGAALWFIIKRFEGYEDTVAREYFIKIHHGMTKVAQFSLAWILIGGIPRTLYYRSFEWANAVAHTQVTALIVKHILSFLIVGAGAYLWQKNSSKVRKIEMDLKKTSGV